MIDQIPSGLGTIPASLWALPAVLSVAAGLLPAHGAWSRRLAVVAALVAFACVPVGIAFDLDAQDALADSGAGDLPAWGVVLWCWLVGWMRPVLGMLHGPGSGPARAVAAAVVGLTVYAGLLAYRSESIAFIFVLVAIPVVGWATPRIVVRVGIAEDVGTVPIGP